MRLTPASLYALKFLASTEPGFASNVTSKLFFVFQCFWISFNTSPIIDGSMRLGVPPPKKTEFNIRLDVFSETLFISFK